METNPEPWRHLDLEGTYNTRDIGGYATEDGRSIRWRTFLRSDSMHRLTTEDRTALIEYGVRTVVDLRTTLETETHPNVFVGSSEVSYIHHNVMGDEPLPAREFIETGVPADMIRSSYTAWLDLRQPQFRQTLATLSDPANRPAIYHCAGGKDRTGVITALLLAIAGVTRATIAEDYALTARYLLKRNLDGQGPLEQEDITTSQQYQAAFCPPAGMLSTLRHLDEVYGGIEGYMRAIGLSGEQIESLRNALLE